MFQGRNIIALIPARNEAQAIAEVIDGCRNLNGRDGKSLIDQVLVCDNGSTDLTAAIAKEHGAKVVRQTDPGYGVACLTMIDELNKRQLSPESILVFIDGDASVNVEEVYDLLQQLNLSPGLVIGCRIESLREPQSMSKVQLLGNSFASWLIKILFGYRVSDLGPFRAISYADLLELSMQDKAFGWTVEMQLKALQSGMLVSEVPVSCRRRVGTSKISGNPVGVVKAGFGIISTIVRQRLSKLIIEQRPINPAIKKPR